MSRGLSVEDQVSAATGGRSSILGGLPRPCGDPRPSLSLCGRGQGHRGPAGEGPKAGFLHSKILLPSPAAGLPPLELPLRLPFSPPKQLALCSLLLQINFEAEERGRGAGPGAQKRGWAPGAREAGNTVGGGNRGGAEGETGC